MTGTILAVAQHLVEDEIVVIPINGFDAAFRMQIWRAKDTTPVVLISQIPGQVPPSSVTETLANSVMGVWLHHYSMGMNYFEKNGKRIQYVTFIGVGHRERLRLMNPHRQTVGKEVLFDYIGQEIAL